MVKKYNVDKDIIQKLTKAVKELTNTLKKNNLKKNTFEKVEFNQPKRVKVDYPGALVSPMVGTVYLSPEPGKKTYIKKDSKINHLSYIGDSNIGKNVNIGAGVITCNYDGIKKNKTKIEDNVFVGSNVSLVAPIK